MARRNIFEIMSSKWDLEEEVDRIYRLCTEYDTIWSHNMRVGYNLAEFVGVYCFGDWKNRGRCIDLDDYLETVDYDGLHSLAQSSSEDMLTFIEITYNLFQMALNVVLEEPDIWRYCTEFTTLQINMDDCLARYNFTTTYIEEMEQVIVIEKDAAVTAVAEISEPELTYDIVQYNHHNMKGDISSKKAILLRIGTSLEPQRLILKNLDRALSQDIFSLLNNLNLRHNNCTEGDKNYIQHVAEMPPAELEEWYDELFQMMLLAKLQIDNIERRKRVQELASYF